MAILTKRAWKRHSNPWSAWTRILSYPLVYLPFWNRSWKQGAAVAAWFSLNPLLFPEPKEQQQQQQSWAMRGVLGEQLWTAERQQDLSMLLSGASATFFAGGLLSAYERQLWPLMFYASAAYLLKLWYIDRMTFYYEQHRKQDKRVETQATTSPTPVYLSELLSTPLPHTRGNKRLDVQGMNLFRCQNTI